MRKVVIMVGVSGSGKSSHSSKLIQEVPNSKVVSADHFFMKGEEYKFDRSKLKDAHGSCFRNFIEALQKELPLVVVDNTNTSTNEIIPYILGSNAFGYEAEIVLLLRAENEPMKEYLEKCAVRNKHGVNLATVMSQMSRIEKMNMPNFWKVSVIR